MGGFPTNQPLVLRRQNLSFLVNMQETGQACGLKGAEEQHCRRASYLTVRLVVQNVDLLCCLRN